MLQEFRTVGYMVNKFSGPERSGEFESYSKTLEKFEADIYRDIKSKVMQINKQLNEMHELLQVRVS
jgi:N-dimethylarginine dimethylaminohydrolase